MQRGNLRAAAKALGEPTESECGLSVDADVAEESDRQRKRCATYLRQAGGGSAAAAPAEAVLLPAQLAVMPVATGGSGDGAADTAGTAGAKLAAAEGQDLSLTGRPYAVEMFGLRKAYKVGLRLGAPSTLYCCGSAWPVSFACYVPHTEVMPAGVGRAAAALFVAPQHRAAELS